MSGQGCPNEGSDSRLFGKWGCWVQDKLSFESDVYPASLTICFPPYVAFNCPIPFTPAHRRYLSIRFGWRFDTAWGYIFPEFILKMKHIPVIY